MFELFGHKTTAILDIWSVIHGLTGIVIASLMFSLVNKFQPKAFTASFGLKINSRELNIWWDLVVVILLIYAWEFTEFTAENGLFGLRVQNWFDGVEYLGNRFIADPILVILGYVIGRVIFFEKKEVGEPAPIRTLFKLGGISVTTGGNADVIFPRKKLFPYLVSWIGRAALVVWFVVNIFFMPHSMMVQDHLIRLFR